MAITRTRAEVAEIIETFLDGTCGPYDFDDFCTFQIADPELDAIRLRCSRLHDDDPSRSPSRYCGERGLAEMREMVRSLREAS